MLRPPPTSTLTVTLFPDTTLFRSQTSVFVTIIVVWEAAARSGLVHPFLLPPFSEVIKRIFEDTVEGSLPIALALTAGRAVRSEEHTSELQSLMRISSAVFCLKKKENHTLALHIDYLTYTNND